MGRLSWVLRVGPKFIITFIPIKRESGGELTQTEEETVCPQNQRLDSCGHKPRNAGGLQKLQEAKNRCFSRASRGCTTLLTGPFQPMLLMPGFWPPEL